MLNENNEWIRMELKPFFRVDYVGCLASQEQDNHTPTLLGENYNKKDGQRYSRIDRRETEVIYRALTNIKSGG